MRGSHRRDRTFGQTALLVLLAAAGFGMVVPIGARAATQMVTVIDAKTSRSAVVQSSGSLQVAVANEPVQTAFTKQLGVSLGAGTGLGCHVITTVPVGKRLVIDTVSADALTPGSEHAETLYVRLPLPVGEADFIVTPTFVTTDTGMNVFEGTQQMQIYAEQKSQPAVCFQRVPSAGSADATFAISGHFVTLVG